MTGRMGEGKKVDSSPYAWPYDGDLRADNTALLIIDMQASSIAQATSSTRSWAMSQPHVEALKTIPLSLQRIVVPWASHPVPAVRCCLLHMHITAQAHLVNPGLWLRRWTSAARAATWTSWVMTCPSPRRLSHTSSESLLVFFAAPSGEGPVRHNCICFHGQPVCKQTCSSC